MERAHFEPEVESRIQRLASLEEDVLITGPTGSGKSAVARRIHELSARRGKPFVPQNCGAIAAELAESTLFGHERGAFTGAHVATEGLVAKANGGTLFLDEIGELSSPVQAKLLTLLQDRRYRRVGSVEERESSFRLIAATHRDLLERCNRGLFRQDLYHRINVLVIALRPLRDTLQLAERIAEGALRESKDLQPIGPEVLAAVRRLTRHPSAWPGNIRELRTFVARCVMGVDAEEQRILEEWGRWRDADGTERLTEITPAVSPTLADRERYAGLIRELGSPGRPKTAFSRKGSLALASRLLEVFPSALAIGEVNAVLGTTDRSVNDNIETLVKHGLVRRSESGLLACWPPATSTLLVRARDGWSPAGPGTIPFVAAGERVRIEIRSRLAGRLGVLMVTHVVGRAPSPAIVVQGKDLPASKSVSLDVELDDSGGLEQLIVHVGPPGHRGGDLVDITVGEGTMPDSAALEQGRRMALEKWHEGWVAEHLVFHTGRS